MIKFHQAQNRHIESIIIARLRRKRLGKIPLDRDSNPRPCAPSFWPRWFVVALASDASGFGLPASPAPWCSSWVVGRMHRDLAVAFLGFGVTKPNPVLHIHLNSTGPTARLTARRYRARLALTIITRTILTLDQNLPILKFFFSKIGPMHFDLPSPNHSNLEIRTEETDPNEWNKLSLTNLT